MRKFKARHPYYGRSASEERYPEDFFTGMAASRPSLGFRPLFSLRLSNRDIRLTRPMINWGSQGRTGIFNIDSLITDPQKQLERIQNGGNYSRDFDDILRFKTAFYKTHYPEIMKARGGLPLNQEFNQRFWKGQLQYSGWSPGQYRVDETHDAPVDPEHHFLNAMFNVADLHHKVLATDNRNYPGKNIYGQLKGFFDENPHLRSENVDWATRHLEELKGAMSSVAGQEYNDVHSDLDKYMTQMGFKTYFREGVAGLNRHTRWWDSRPEPIQTGLNKNYAPLNPDNDVWNSPNRTALHTWLYMPDRSRPYAIHVRYHYNPLAVEGKQHLVTVEKHLGMHYNASFKTIQEAPGHIGAAINELHQYLKTPASQEYVTHRLIQGLLGLNSQDPDSWGFGHDYQKINLGNSPEEFKSSFLGL